jgi:arylsulfatase
MNFLLGIAVETASACLRWTGKEVARQSMERTLPIALQWEENFDIGADTGTPVSDDHQVPFRFTGIQQAYAQNRPAAADACGHREAEASYAQQPGG